MIAREAEPGVAPALLNRSSVLHMAVLRSASTSIVVEVVVSTDSSVPDEHAAPRSAIARTRVTLDLLRCRVAMAQR